MNKTAPILACEAVLNTRSVKHVPKVTKQGTTLR